MSVYPRMFRLRQTFPRIRVEDVPGEVRRQLEALALPRKIRAGQTVAMTAGSRSIANVHLILQTASRFIRSLGAEPLIVPAMGSHGGATAAGQKPLSLAVLSKGV